MQILSIFNERICLLCLHKTSRTVIFVIFIMWVGPCKKKLVIVFLLHLNTWCWRMILIMIMKMLSIFIERIFLLCLHMTSRTVFSVICIMWVRTRFKLYFFYINESGSRLRLQTNWKMQIQTNILRFSNFILPRYIFLWYAVFLLIIVICFWPRDTVKDYFIVK